MTAEQETAGFARARWWRVPELRSIARLRHLAVGVVLLPVTVIPQAAGGSVGPAAGTVLAVTGLFALLALSVGLSGMLQAARLARALRTGTACRRAYRLSIGPATRRPVLLLFEGESTEDALPTAALFLPAGGGRPAPAEPEGVAEVYVHTVRGLQYAVPRVDGRPVGTVHPALLLGSEEAREWLVGTGTLLLPPEEQVPGPGTAGHDGDGSDDGSGSRTGSAAAPFPAPVRAAVACEETVRALAVRRRSGWWRVVGGLLAFPAVSLAGLAGSAAQGAEGGGGTLPAVLLLAGWVTAASILGAGAVRLWRCRELRGVLRVHPWLVCAAVVLPGKRGRPVAVLRTPGNGRLWRLERRGALRPSSGGYPLDDGGTVWWCGPPGGTGVLAPPGGGARFVRVRPSPGDALGPHLGGEAMRLLEARPDPLPPAAG